MSYLEKDQFLNGKYTKTKFDLTRAQVKKTHPCWFRVQSEKCENILSTIIVPTATAHKVILIGA